MSRLPKSSLFRRFVGSYEELSDARFNRRRCLPQQLEHHGYRDSTVLLDAGMGLSDNLASGPQIVGVEIRQPQPAFEGFETDSTKSGGLFVVPRTKQSGDDTLFLVPVFCSVAGHLGDTWGSSGKLSSVRPRIVMRVTLPLQQHLNCAESHNDDLPLVCVNYQPAVLASISKRALPGHAHRLECATLAVSVRVALTCFCRL